MDNRRGDKIVEIEGYVSNLRDFLPSDFDGYIGDALSKAACERCFEKVVEAVVDLAFLVIKERGFKNPDYTREAFEILAENGLISSELSLNLGKAKSMRNWLVHRYGKIDDKKVFYAIKNKLFSYIEEFLEAVR